MASIFPIRKIEDVVDAYVVSRGRSHFLSIAHALRAIRTLMPSSSISDRELADMVAISAIERSVPVFFDGRVDPKCTEAFRNEMPAPH